jgi:predicted molibdopterin-dependent oxidoreductase YjgC
MDDLRVPATRDPSGMVRADAMSFLFEGGPVRAYPGETIATALLAAGTRALRRTRVAATPRGLFCAIGACHDCLVTVDGEGPVRACMTPAADGQRVEGHDVHD